MCVLGYGSGGLVQRMWFRRCGSGVVDQGVGEKTWLRSRPFKFEKK